MNFSFSLPLICCFLYTYKICKTCKYLNLNFMEYPECETCSVEILVTNVSCGVSECIITTRVYKQCSKWYDCKIIFVFCCAIRFDVNQKDGYKMFGEKIVMERTPM